MGRARTNHQPLTNRHPWDRAFPGPQAPSPRPLLRPTLHRSRTSTPPHLGARPRLLTRPPPQLGVMALDKPLLLAAYALLLAGLAARLCLPRVEAGLFDAFNELDRGLFWSNLQLAMGEAWAARRQPLAISRQRSATSRHAAARHG